MKTTIIIIVAIAVVVAVGAGVGGFFGGRAYESNHATTVQNDFLRSRGLNPNATPGAGQFTGQNGAGFPGGGFGRGATGQIKSIDGNTLTLTEGQNTVTVTLSGTTLIEKTASGSTADLQAGQEVMVTGQRDTSGNLTAVQVIILPAPMATPTPSSTTP